MLIGTSPTNSNRSGRIVEGLQLKHAAVGVAGTWHWSTFRDLNISDCVIGVDIDAVNVEMERSHFESNGLHLQASGTASSYTSCTFLNARGPQSIIFDNQEGLTFERNVVERNRGPMVYRDVRLVRHLGGWMEANGGDDEILVGHGIRKNGTKGVAVDGTYFNMREGQRSIVHSSDFSTSATVTGINGNLRGASSHAGRVADETSPPIGIAKR